MDSIIIGDLDRQESFSVYIGICGLAFVAIAVLVWIFCARNCMIRYCKHVCFTQFCARIKRKKAPGSVKISKVVDIKQVVESELSESVAN